LDDIYNSAISRCYHRYMTLKPVSPSVIPTPSELPRAGDMGIRDQLKEDWGWLRDT